LVAQILVDGQKALGFFLETVMVKDLLSGLLAQAAVVGCLRKGFDCLGG
jgi:hypothetical protein